jgi:hypothetical protein
MADTDFRKEMTAAETLPKAFHKKREDSGAVIRESEIGLANIEAGHQVPLVFQ